MIEEIAVGRRVRSDPDPLAPPRAGPGDPADPDSYDEIDPATWRRVELRMEDAERGRIRMTLLRPIAWLMLLGAEVGAEIPVQLPELGLVGTACVTAVEPCPVIEAGPAGTAVVTGTFVTDRAPLIDLYVVGLDRPIGVTPGHPFYSEDRGAWVGAGNLRPGEHIRTTGGRATIDRIATRATPETVYNLEVQGRHTYSVTRLQILAHNECSLVWKPSPASHVRLHNVNNLAKNVHGVFYDDAVYETEQAWARARLRGLAPNASGELVVPMGRAIGWEGGRLGSGRALTRVKIIVTKAIEVITAYPVP